MHKAALATAAAAAFLVPHSAQSQKFGGIVSGGPMQPARGGFGAPVELRIVYNRQGGLETRQATINCRMNNAGRVIAAA